MSVWPLLSQQCPFLFMQGQARVLAIRDETEASVRLSSRKKEEERCIASLRRYVNYSRFFLYSFSLCQLPPCERLGRCAYRSRYSEYFQRDGAERDGEMSGRSSRDRRWLHDGRIRRSVHPTGF